MDGTLWTTRSQFAFAFVGFAQLGDHSGSLPESGGIALDFSVSGFNSRSRRRMIFAAARFGQELP